MSKRYFFSLKAALVLLLMTGTGCNDWLNIKPENEQTNGDFWTTKEEVRSVMMGAYEQMRNCLQSLVWWGEIRSDEVDLGPGYTDNEEMLSIKSLTIDPTNKVVNWGNMYTVIGRCNAVIKCSDLVLEHDKTFSQKASDAYKAEAIWLRSLCYFYLVRSFCDVPYITEPYLDDNQSFRVAKTEGKVILQHLITDLNVAMHHIPVSYTTYSWENKGRATVWSLYALLADIYLWAEDYDNAVKMCSNLERSELYQMMDNKDWYKLYYPGNSRESIFELQWSANNLQLNSLFAWFYGGDGNKQQYALSETAIEKFNMYNDEKDIRGKGGTYVEESLKGWKYAGTSLGGENIRETSLRDANWIIYRFADILMMKAEALVMLGGQANYEAAYAIITNIRTRAGYTQHPPMPTSETEYIDLILDERLREFALEGKRWFDLVRTAIRKDGLYKNKLINLLLMNVDAKDRPLYEVKLQNAYGYYFPINDSDITASGGLLLQNPFYL